MIRNRISYLLVLLSVIWIFIAYYDYSALALLVITAVIPVITFIITFIASRRIKASICTECGIVTRGNSAKVSVNIANPSVLPMIGAKIYVDIEHEYEHTAYTKILTLNLPDREVSKFDIDITPAYCGRIKVSVKKFKIYDFLGLWSYKGKIAGGCGFISVPELNKIHIRINERNSEYIDDPVKFSDSTPGDDPSEVFDVREYQSGDKVQRIHWKMSAKLDDVYVKEFSMPIDASAVIFADMSMANMEDRVVYADAVIESVYLLTVNLLEQQVFHYVSWYDAKNKTLVKQEISGEEDIWKAIYGIINVPLYQGEEGIRCSEKEGSAVSEALCLYITPLQDVVPGDRRAKVFRMCKTHQENASDGQVVYVNVGRVHESLSYIGEI